MTTPSKSAIIVGHGQPSAPDPAEDDLADFTARIAAFLPGWHVQSATLAKPGALSRALDMSESTPFVYPMFMSEGWFTQTQLVNRIGAHPAHILPPFGVDPGLPAMAAALLQAQLKDWGWEGAKTQLFIAGHGSGRSPNAARDTYAFAQALEELITLAEIRVGFVEQAPFLEDTAKGLSPQAISLPFFAFRLGHVIDDVPQALDKTGFSGLRLDPIGCAPGAPALIAAALKDAHS